MSKQALYPLLLAAVLAYVFSCFLGYAGEVQLGGVMLFRYAWIPNLDIDFALRLDGLSLIFSLLISGIGALIFAYSARYMLGKARTGYFFTVLFLFALAMLGLVLADHFMVLFIFWELTAITSYLLIGYNNESHIARRNALQALLVTGGGGLVLFAGLVWLGVSTGSFYLTDLLADVEIIPSLPYVDWIFGCIFLGCITKSAQVPFHFWLPNAMAAPTPVSAYLHSATMVKAGIYLLARLQPAFGDLELWTPLLGTLGAITAVWASMVAITQSDLKQLLAYTTLMALGTLTFLLAFPTEAMAVAAMVFLVVHALYKACLFMVIGIVDVSTGTREREKLSGLGRRMPIVWITALLAGLSMAGIPLLFGFIAKELQYEAAMHVQQSNLAIITLMAANALMICAAYLVAIKPFKSEASETVQKFEGNVPLLLWLSPALLAACGLVFGLLPMNMYPGYLEQAVNSVAGTQTAFHLAIWHGINQPLLLSIITLCLGGILIAGFAKSEAYCNRLKVLIPAVEPLYFKKLEMLKRASIFITATLHDGSLEHYLKIIISVVFGSVLVVILQHYSPASLIPTFPSIPDWIGISLSVLGVAGAFYAITATSKIMALASLGASGFAMSGIFLLYGALDVAMTQLLVETLFVILAAGILWRIPEMSLNSTCHRDARRVNLLISILAGVTTTAILMVILKQPLDTSLTYFFEHASLTLANGRNIVNVILVDFRAFDTFGEISVVAAAALGLWAMTQGTSKKGGAV